MLLFSRTVHSNCFFFCFFQTRALTLISRSSGHRLPISIVNLFRATPMGSIVPNWFCQRHNGEINTIDAHAKENGRIERSKKIALPPIYSEFVVNRGMGGGITHGTRSESGRYLFCSRWALYAQHFIQRHQVSTVRDAAPAGGRQIRTDLRRARTAFYRCRRCNGWSVLCSSSNQTELCSTIADSICSEI